MKFGTYGKNAFGNDGRTGNGGGCGGEKPPKIVTVIVEIIAVTSFFF